ncbi:HD domain-containing protein [Actinomadura scrupuli]|uniref:HD domain-containing protein n=1 Tax=Actinomadura scrupuli TaxID=559629 RepID=UPI003D9666EF
MTGRADASLEPLLQVLPRTLTAEQARLIERAYTVAAYWHRDQTRRSGDPYITHPVAVATILAELGGDHELLCAALLHDVLEDTACTRAQLAAEFSEPITELVTGLRALEESGRLDACTDERVLILKLADRLHNLRTLRFLPPDRRRLKAQQTLEVLAPLAGRLGLDQIRRELETLAKAGLAGPGQSGVRLSFHALTAGAVLLPRHSRARWLEEWLSDLHELPDRRSRTRFATQLLAGMPRLAVALRSATGLPDLAIAAALRVIGWVLGSHARVWALLTPLVAWMTLQAAASGPADAVAVLITVPPVLGAGVRAARDRLRASDRDNDP